MEYIDKTPSTQVLISSGIEVMEIKSSTAQLKVNGYTCSFIQWAEQENQIKRTFTFTDYDPSINVLSFYVGLDLYMEKEEFDRSFRETITDKNNQLVDRYGMSLVMPMRISYSSLGSDF